MIDRVYHLKDLEEVVGTLSGLIVDEGHLIATVWKLRLLLPIEMEPILLPLLNQKVAIVRIDSDYRSRVINSPRPNEQNNATSLQGHGGVV